MTAATDPKALAEAAERVANAAIAVAEAFADLFAAQPEARPYGLTADTRTVGHVAR